MKKFYRLLAFMYPNSYVNRLMAIPDLNPGCQYALAWIRKDWMDKVGANVLQTVDNVIALAQKFVDSKPDGKGKTVGIEVQNDGNIGGDYNYA